MIPMPTLTIDFRIAMFYDIFRTFPRTNVCPGMKGETAMHLVDKYIAEIKEIIEKLNENELLYILTFMKKMFGSR